MSDLSEELHDTIQEIIEERDVDGLVILANIDSPLYDGLWEEVGDAIGDVTDELPRVREDEENNERVVIYDEKEYVYKVADVMSPGSGSESSPIYDERLFLEEIRDELSGDTILEVGGETPKVDIPPAVEVTAHNV